MPNIKSKLVYFVDSPEPEEWGAVKLNPSGWIICRDLTSDRQIVKEIMYPPHRISSVETLRY